MTGSRPRVLLLHGFLATRTTWGPLLEVAGDGVEFIVPNLPGYGTEPNPEGPYTLEAVLDRLERVVRTLQPSHVVGHSMGAVLALALAARLHGRIEGVGLIAVPIFKDRRDGRAFIRRRGWIPRAFLSRDRTAHIGCRFLHAWHGSWCAAGSTVTAIPPGILRSMFDHTREAHAGSLDEIVCAGLVPRAAQQVHIPVAMLHGEDDRSAPLGRAKALAERHNWRLEVLSDSNHQLVIHDVEDVWEWMREEVLGLGEDPEVPSTAEPRTLVP